MHDKSNELLLPSNVTVDDLLIASTFPKSVDITGFWRIIKDRPDFPHIYPPTFEILEANDLPDLP